MVLELYFQLRRRYPSYSSVLVLGVHLCFKQNRGKLVGYVRVPLLDLFEILGCPLGRSIVIWFISPHPWRPRLWLTQPPRNLCGHLPISNILINRSRIGSIVLLLQRSQILTFSVMFCHRAAHFLEAPDRVMYCIPKLQLPDSFADMRSRLQLRSIKYSSILFIRILLIQHVLRMKMLLMLNR